MHNGSVIMYSLFKTINQYPIFNFSMFYTNKLLSQSGN